MLSEFKQSLRQGEQIGIADGRRHPVLIGGMYLLAGLIALILPISWYWRLPVFLLIIFLIGFVRNAGSELLPLILINALGAGLVIGLWLILPPLSVGVAIVWATSFRRYVIPRAAFWGTRHILLIGILWGVAVGTGLSVAISYATSSALASALLYFLGAAAVAVIGDQPSLVDIYRKAEQTRAVALSAYLVVVTGDVLWRVF